jgi:hypothetical protein
MRKRWLSLLCIALPVAACPGDPIPPPPSAELDTAGDPAMISRDPTSSLRIGTLDIVLEKTTMASVLDTLGVGRIDHRGDAGESTYWICYTASAQGQRIWLTSDELHGGRYVDGVTAIALSGPTAPTDACPELPASAAPIRPAQGPWLGASPAETFARFGEASQDGDRWSYGYLGKEGGYDVYATLVMRFTGERATYVLMGRETTN